MAVPKIVVHTDVLVEHLGGGKSPSVLRQAMAKFFCYTTVFQAMELFSMAKSAKEVEAAEASMAALKLLGVNPKNAKHYGELLRSSTDVGMLNVMVSGLCLESRLPLLTDRRSDFAGIKGLLIVPTKLVAACDSGTAILSAAVGRRGKLSHK